MPVNQIKKIEIQEKLDAITATSAISQIKEIQAVLDAIAPDLCRDAHADYMIAAHHLSKVIKEESDRLNRQQRVKKNSC